MSFSLHNNYILSEYARADAAHPFEISFIPFHEHLLDDPWHYLHAHDILYIIMNCYPNTIFARAKWEYLNDSKTRELERGAREQPKNTHAHKRAHNFIYVFLVNIR